MADNYLFAYGTLLNGENEFAIYLKKNCSFYANGRFKGRLYDMGEYPGAINDEHSSTYVHGSIFIIRNVKSVLKQLDYYEGFSTDEEQPNLFIRKPVEIESDTGIVRCWCYLYNLPVDGLPLIASGDYVKYKEPAP